jgi:hypothetical protein
MAVRKYLVALLAVGAWLSLSAVASAAFPDYTGCDRSTPNFQSCVDIQSVSGVLDIKGFEVPLGESLEIRGALREDGAGGSAFVPATGTNGFFADPVEVPGGLLGIDWIPGNRVLAITELAGSPSDIRLNASTFTIALPVKVRLVNIFIGMNCHIGTNSNPVTLNLVPRAAGRIIVPTFGEIHVLGQVNGDDSFAVPGASSCGLGLGLINSLVNLRLGLPSSSGENSIEVTNNIALKAL